jgi:hypothetical protein
MMWEGNLEELKKQPEEAPAWQSRTVRIVNGLRGYSFGYNVNNRPGGASQRVLCCEHSEQMVQPREFGRKLSDGRTEEKFAA